MRITPIQNYKYNNLKFTSCTPADVNWRECYDPKNNTDNNNKKQIPEWLRKSVLFGLVTLTIANDPLTQEYLCAEREKQQEKVLNEYFKDVSKLEYPASHHLNQLADVDKPVIIKHYNDYYRLKFNLDDNQEIILDVKISQNNQNKINGGFRLNNHRFMFFEAVFNPKNPDECEIKIRNSENKKIIIGRKENGEIYKLEKGKKIILNKENAKRYQDEIKIHEIANNLEFLRKINLILLLFLTLKEWEHDLKIRKEESGSDR